MEGVFEDSGGKYVDLIDTRSGIYRIKPKQVTTSTSYDWWTHIMKTILLIRCDNRNLVSVEYVQIHSLIPASKQDELLMSWWFSMSFKRIQDVPSWMSWVYRILQSSLFSSLLPWRQKNMWSCSSASVMFCVCWSFSSEKRKSQMYKHNMSLNALKTKWSCSMWTVTKVRMCGVCGSPVCILSFLHWKKTSLNSNVMLPASQILYISKLVAPKFDLRYEQQKKILELLGFADSKRCLFGKSDPGPYSSNMVMENNDDLPR